MTVSELRLKLSNKIREAAPESSRVIEVFGFFVLSFGIFLGMSLYSYDVSDIEKLNQGTFSVSNLSGPLGARLSNGLYSLIGSASLIWPIAFLLWGGLIAFGFITSPKAKRFVAFLLLSGVLSAYTYIENIAFISIVLPEGNGGIIGQFIGGTLLLNTVGYGGTLLFLAFAAVAALVLTRNLKFSTVGHTVEYLRYSFKRSVTEKKEIRKQNKISSTTSREDLENMQDAFVFEDTPIAKTKPKKKKETNLEADIDSEEDLGFKLDFGSPARKTQKVDFKIFSKSNIVSSKMKESQALTDELTHKLAEFKTEGHVTNVTEGPVVTTFEFEPIAGTKISKIKSLESDLARLLKATSLRILAPVPGKNTVGFEIPNEDRKVICFGNLVESTEYKSKKMSLPIAMGVDTFGKPVIEDMAEMPHLLVAGATGSGKSVFINTLLASLLAKHNTKDLRLVLFDPKMVELGMYNDAAHLACPVITDPKKDGMAMLESLVDEMENRYRLLNEIGAKNIKHFNELIKSHRKTEFPKFNGKWQTMPYVVVVIDEFADMMLVLGKEAEEAITRLAQKARAAGIHLVIATQRPSVQVISGLIKANFPTRVAFRVMSGVDSRTILDQQGAETLLGKGDMLYQNSAGLHRLHGGYLEEKEIEKLVKACK